MVSLALNLLLSPSPAVEGKIVAASLFKNGYAVIVREADLGPDGRVDLVPPATAVLGTLWISGSKGVTLSKVWSTRVEKEGVRDIESLDELLTANFEKNVTLETTSVFQGQTTIVKGRIISSKGPMVVLEQENDRIALFKSAIVRVLAADHGLNFRLPTKTSENVLAVTGKGNGKVYWVNLQRGMTWAPAYQVSLVDEKSLRLVGKATILNDLATLENVEVGLVTGFPNVRFLNLLDPLSSGQSVAEYVQSLAYAATNPEFRRDALMNQAPGGFGGGAGGRFEADQQMQPSGTGEQLEDLFLYRQPGVSLKAGERGYFTVMSAQAEYKQEYDVVIPDTNWNVRPETAGVPPVPPDVWHTLKFKNPTGQPLTTAPAITMKNDEILGQDVLNYTSAGAEVSLRVTKALDINVEVLEEETARERGALKIENRATYDRVTLKGTIELKNNKSKAVQMKVTKLATGEVVQAGGGEARKTPAGLRSVNPSSQIVWRPLLESGKSLRLEYTVSVLVPSAGY